MAESPRSAADPHDRKPGGANALAGCGGRTALGRLVLTALWLTAGGCASAGANADEDGRLRVSLRDYAGGARFELVSESHTDRVAYYSSARAEASGKVLANEVVQALVEELDRLGLAEHAQEGRAPSLGGSLISRAFEVQRGGRTVHWAVGPGSPVEERVAFNDSMKPFLELYNMAQSFQTVHNPLGPAYFDENPATGRPPRDPVPR